MKYYKARANWSSPVLKNLLVLRRRCITSAACIGFTKKLKHRNPTQFIVIFASIMPMGFQIQNPNSRLDGDDADQLRIKSS